MARRQSSSTDFDNPEGTLPWSAAASCGQPAPAAGPPAPTSVPAGTTLPATGGDADLSRWAVAAAALGGLVHLARRRITDNGDSA